MASIKQLTGSIVFTLLAAGCTRHSSTPPISKAIQPSAQPSQVSSRLTTKQEMELYHKQIESWQRGMDNASEAARIIANARWLDDSYTVAQADNTPVILVGQDGAFLGVVSNDQYADKSICNRYGNFGSRYSSTSVLDKYEQYGDTYSNLSAYNPNAQQPPLIIQNGQPIGLLTKNRRLQGGVDPDVFFNQVCGG